MPTIGDATFEESVVYLCDHSPEGAMGIIINQPTDIKLADISEHLEFEPETAEIGDTPLYHGGPVQKDRGFILHRAVESTSFDHTVPLSRDLCITTSMDILKAIASGQGPADFLIALGYASWKPGQLEEELADNAWLHVPLPSTDVLFDLPVESCWQACGALLGVDILSMSSEVGHA